MLSIREVRDRLRNDLPVQVNENANWNNQNKTETDYFLYEYMAKNLYFIEGWSRYGYGIETDESNPVKYITLSPKGCERCLKGDYSIKVTDDDCFWC